MLNAVIIEDESHAVRRLSMVLRQVPDLTVAGVARDGAEGLDLIRKLDPDIAFVDINLPGMNGLEVARALGGAARPAIIFVTAYDAHAVEAFRLAAVHYLLKPVQQAQVVEAVARARARTDTEREQLDTLIRTITDLSRDGGRDVGRAAGDAGYDAEMWVTGRRGTVRLLLHTVDWFEAERDYIRIHAEGAEYLIREPLHALEARLDAKRFLRVRRSAVVNVDKVARIERGENGRLHVHLACGGVVAVGGTYTDAVRALIPRAGGGARSHRRVG